MLWKKEALSKDGRAGGGLEGGQNEIPISECRVEEFGGDARGPLVCPLKIGLGLTFCPLQCSRLVPIATDEFKVFFWPFEWTWAQDLALR